MVGNVKSNVKYHIFSISEVTTMAGAIIQNSITKRPIIIIIITISYYTLY